MAASVSRTPPNTGSSRRQFLLGGAAAGLGAVLAVSADRALRPQEPASSPVPDVVPFHGVHQSGITVAPQAHALFLAFDLHADVDAAALRRLMRLLTDDAARLTAGRGALADTEPELALAPARLTVTFGFGPGFVESAGGSAPPWLRPLPAFSIDRLQDGFSHGDLLLIVASDDPITVSHAGRMLVKDTRAFASVRWAQQGFRRARGTEAPSATMRNLFGQLDGTVNAAAGSADFDGLVWSTDGWLAGGTGFVLRRIEMNLDTWDELDTSGREQATGRFVASGAPLTGVHEHDEPDFDARGSTGFPVIPEFSHLRRARSDDPRERIVRLGYNYDDAGTSSGLLFGSFQADVDRQYVPLQRRLDELDLLNTWTTPIGSAVFALPPGCAEGGFIGETLLG